MTTLLTKEEILQNLNISPLTLDNWVKNFIPNALSNNLYDLTLITSFIEKEHKLCQRANKKQSCIKQIPKELLKYLKNEDWIESYLAYICDKSFELVAEELIHTLQQRIYKMFCNDPLEKIIPYNEIYAFSVAYQILLNSGEKSRTGAYYTPKFIVNDILESLIEKNKSMLEPCCGVGFFAIEYIFIYIKKFNELPQNLIFCNDIDPYAVQITKSNIEYLFPELKFQIKCEDGLELQWNQKFDFIITNPPYGIKHKHHTLKTTEIFSQFIYSSLFKYLNKDGIMNFVLPSSVLDVNKHKEIRKIILNQFSLERIKFYGKSFFGVFSDIVFIQVKNNNQINDKVHIILQDSFYIHQQKFIDNNYIISITNPNENNYIDEYYKIPHITLEQAYFNLGIVTGNNSFFLSDIPKKNTLPILSGKEIEPGKIIYKNQKYILNLLDKIQQKPKNSYFLKNKIIYRFISNKIITAVDYSGILTLNSANFFIVENSNLSLEYISALLNSDIMQKIHKIKNGNPLKILKQHLKILPIFIFQEDVQKLIEQNYKSGLTKENDLIIEKQIRNYLKLGKF